MAPLAGITNLPFRLMAKRAGCGLVCSEMISSNGLVYKAKKTLAMLESTPEEKPLSVQIFGSNPEIMAEAAELVEESGADILDINFGCSVRKVIKTGSGVALMKNPSNTEAVLRAVRKAVKIPLTIKIRSGWDSTGEQALRIARIAQECGVDAIAVHPRTASQGFRGNADWAIIAEVKRALSIPVIGNGDIKEARDALKMIGDTGCDAVMIGRAAIGNPHIFDQIVSLLQDKPITPVETDQRFEMMRHYLRASVEYLGEKQACFMMRSRLGWFVKGLRFSSSFRESIKKVSTEDEALEKIEAYQEMLEKIRYGKRCRAT
jgi:nifR3 family TIM-barrel protein